MQALRVEARVKFLRQYTPASIHIRLLA